MLAAVEAEEEAAVAGPTGGGEGAAEERPAAATESAWARNRTKILMSAALGSGLGQSTSPKARVNPYTTPLHDQKPPGAAEGDGEEETEARSRLIVVDYLVFALGAYLCGAVPLFAALAARDDGSDGAGSVFYLHVLIDAVLAVEIAAKALLDLRKRRRVSSHNAAAAAAGGGEGAGDGAPLNPRRGGRRQSAPLDPALHVSKASIHRIGSILLEKEELVGLLGKREGPSGYVRSAQFAVDVVSVLPLEYIALAAHTSWRWVPLYRLNRLLRLRRVFSFVWFFRVAYLRLSIVRLTKTTVGIALIVHYATCCWLVVSLLQGYAYRNELQQEESSALYLLAFYWSFQSIVKSPPDFSIVDLTNLRFAETIVSTLCMLVGVLTTVLLVGHVSSLIAGFDSVSNRHYDNVERVNQLCDNKRLPAELRERMLGFLEFSHKRRAADQTVLQELSTAIQKDVSLHLCSRMVSRVPFFTDCEPGFLYSIILLLRPQLCAPRDVLIWQRECPPGMWFVGSGSLAVLQELDGEYSVVAELTGGSFFGEMALLSNSKAGATVEASDFCELYFLSRDDFHSVLSHYPHVLAKMQEIVRQRQSTLDNRRKTAVPSKPAGGGEESEPLVEAVTTATLEAKLRLMRDEVMDSLGSLERRLDKLYS